MKWLSCLTRNRSAPGLCVPSISQAVCITPSMARQRTPTACASHNREVLQGCSAFQSQARPGQTTHARFHGAFTGTAVGGRLAELSQTMLDMKFQLAEMARAAQSRPTSPDAGPQHHQFNPQFNQITNISQVSWTPHQADHTPPAWSAMCGST